MLKDISKFVNIFNKLVKKASIFSKVRELPDSLKKALAEVNYTKSDISLTPSEFVSPYGAGGAGRKDFFMLVNFGLRIKGIHIRGFCQAVSSDSCEYRIFGAPKRNICLKTTRLRQRRDS